MFILLLKKYLSMFWPYALGALLIFGLCYHERSVGYHKAELACQAATIKETERRINEAGKEESKTKETISQIHQARKKEPHNDARDSCLLSNDPFSKDCL